jgi:hypothetical protein
MPSASRRTLAVAIAALLLLAATVALIVVSGSRTAVNVAGGDGSGAQAAAAPDARGEGFRVRLLPDAGISAQPASVRIGLAWVSPDDEAAYRAWLRSGRDGAGPSDFADMASVTRWIDVPARLQADGSVLVGPMRLPDAQRYVLQARADDGLRFYEARFAREDAPAQLRPRVAAGLRVRAPRGVDALGEGDVSVLLRRVEGGQDAAWQGLLRREAMAVLDAYDERPLAISAQAAQTTRIAPLPPGPVEVVAVVRGLETERRRITLVAGRDVVLDLDAAAAELGDALAANLTLRPIDADTRAPVRDLLAVWPSPRGEQRVRPGADAALRFDGVDTSEPMLLELRFERQGPPPSIADSGRIESLPRWPERLPLRLDLSEARAVGGRIEKTIELRPLRWLVVETPGIDVPRRPRGGDPFPVFVVQHAQGETWRDAAAEAFRPLDEGIAVSLDEPGRVRVAALLSPWQVAFSDTVESRADASLLRTRLRTANGRDASLRIVAGARPLAFAPVQVVSPIRGVPPKTLTTDRNGRILLPGATVPTLSIEAPGFEQAEVRLQAGEATLSLRAEAATQR